MNGEGGGGGGRAVCLLKHEEKKWFKSVAFSVLLLALWDWSISWLGILVWLDCSLCYADQKSLGDRILLARSEK